MARHPCKVCRQPSPVIQTNPGSGMIRDVGPVYRRKLLKAFGVQVFNLIEVEKESPA